MSVLNIVSFARVCGSGLSGQCSCVCATSTNFTENLDLQALNLQNTFSSKRNKLFFINQNYLIAIQLLIHKNSTHLKFNISRFFWDKSVKYEQTILFMSMCYQLLSTFKCSKKC